MCISRDKWGIIDLVHLYWAFQSLRKLTLIRRFHAAIISLPHPLSAVVYSEYNFESRWRMNIPKLNKQSSFLEVNNWVRNPRFAQAISAAWRLKSFFGTCSTITFFIDLHMILAWGTDLGEEDAGTCINQRFRK